MLYKKGTFGYYWTVIKGNPDIKGNVYDRVIDCSNNNLTSLEGAPKEVRSSFYCYKNNLKSLKGGPEIVTGEYYCNLNQLTNLEGAPKEVKIFKCNDNRKILKDAFDIFATNIKDKFICDIMSDKEYRQGRELYLKLKDLDKVRKIYKLKNKMR